MRRQIHSTSSMNNGNGAIELNHGPTELLVVKRISLHGVKGRGVDLLVNEVRLLAMLQHRHIVKLRYAFVETGVLITMRRLEPY